MQLAVKSPPRKSIAGFDAAWASLMEEFGVLVRKRQDGVELDELEDYEEFVETSFRLVRNVRHAIGNLTVIITCDGFDAHIAVFTGAGDGNKGRGEELTGFDVSYGDLLDEHEEVRERLLLSLR